MDMEEQTEKWVPNEEELRLIDEGLADVSAGRVYTIEEVQKQMVVLKSELSKSKSKDSA